MAQPMGCPCTVCDAVYAIVGLGKNHYNAFLGAPKNMPNARTHTHSQAHTQSDRCTHTHTHTGAGCKQNLLFVVFTNASVGAEPAEAAAAGGESRKLGREGKRGGERGEERGVFAAVYATAFPVYRGATVVCPNRF